LAELGHEFLVAALHGLEEDEFFEKKDEFHFGVLEIRLESVFLFLHFADFFVEVVHEFVDFAVELLLLVNEFDFTDLIKLLQTLAILSLAVLPLDDLESVRVDIGLVGSLSWATSSSTLLGCIVFLIFGELGFSLFSQLFLLCGSHALSLA